MRNKFFSVLIIMLVVLVSFTNVFAADDLFQFDEYSDIYKLTEQSEIKLPFFNVFNNAATYDKDVKHSGISFGNTTIDVDKKLEGVHIIFSNDMVTIDGEVENALIYGTNVVVKGKITGDSVIIAPTVQILEQAVVEKDVIIIANNLDLKGIVNGNVIATISDKANILGKINKDLRIIARNANVESKDIKGEIYIETASEVTGLKEKYPEAIVKVIREEEQEKIDWMELITSGIITVVVYTVICLLVTRKQGNIAEKTYLKFKNNCVFGIVASFGMIALIIILPIILLLIALFGFGILAWPILIAYLGIILLVISTASLIVGMTIFEAIKVKVGKYKIPVCVLIFTGLYILTKIPMIAMYANLSIILIALAIVVTMITKRLPKEEKIENKETN